MLQHHTNSKNLEGKREYHGSPLLKQPKGKPITEPYPTKTIHFEMYQQKCDHF